MEHDNIRKSLEVLSLKVTDLIQSTLEPEYFEVLKHFGEVEKILSSIESKKTESKDEQAN